MVLGIRDLRFVDQQNGVPLQKVPNEPSPDQKVAAAAQATQALDLEDLRNLTEGKDR